jgi:chlorite dismutase
MTIMTDFIGGSNGQWRITQMKPVIGESIPVVSHLSIVESELLKSETGVWTLRGFNSNVRYAEKIEKEKLAAVQEGLGRMQATCAALIPIRKSEAWWALAQDERRAIFEKQSHHTETGLKYLPAIARKLYHCRDIGEPFDFLTWFEYAPEHSEFFEELVATLRKTEEWKYVDREVDIRLSRV